MPTLDSTVGGPLSNSFELLSEANTYFDERLPLPTPWVASGDASVRALIMATRVLNAMALPHKTLRRDSCDCQYYLTARQWAGSPASATQRLAWPRIGLFDSNGNPLDVLISSNSVASPSVVTTVVPHGRTTDDKVFIVGSNSTPVIDGTHTIIVLSTTAFSVPVNVTVAGTVGRMTIIPQALKDAQSELAGQLLISDTTLDNSVSVQGLTSVKAGSVALTFKENIAAHVLPDAVMNLLPPGWLTDEIISYPANAEFGVI